jgi:hypothetical protein
LDKEEDFQFEALSSNGVELPDKVFNKNDLQFYPHYLFSAITKIDLAKSIPKYRWREDIK